MKSIIHIIITTLFLIGCNKHQPSLDKWMDEVEKAIKVNPDSALTILDSISSPETMNDNSFARWCMLSGKITDKIHNTLLSTVQFKRAYEWYSKYGTPTEEVQILIYMGRSYVEDGDYDQAMTIYIQALNIAQNNKLENQMGYIYSYMGDLYEETGMLEQASNKYKAAAKHFKIAQNTNSYICALRDIGREYAGMDSLSFALEALLLADSIIDPSLDVAIKASILNSIGNIYLMQQEYDKAKPYFYKALVHGTNKMPNYISLVQTYIETDSLTKAKEMLQSVPREIPQYAYSIERLYYLIHKTEKRYDLALGNMEKCVNIIDSIVGAENQKNILNIEKKYNDLKHREKINDLTISRQKYVIVLAICAFVILTMIFIYMWYRKKVAADNHKQQIELSEVKMKLLHLSIELEEKQQILSTLEEKEEEYNKIKVEIANVVSNYKKLQSNLITNSSIYKELVRLANQVTPRAKKSLITEKQWCLIEKEIMSIYPNLYSYILDICPEISDQEWKYCCFCMFGFDITSEAKLLNINSTSVSTKRLRLKQKLNILLPPKMSFYEYIALKLM